MLTGNAFHLIPSSEILVDFVCPEAKEEFMDLWLEQLGQADLPWEGLIICVLATAHKTLPRLVAKNRIGAVWMSRIEALTSLTDSDALTCSPEDPTWHTTAAGLSLQVEDATKIDFA